jgi:hypothetical protein
VLDMPHMFKLTARYDLPFGPRRAYLSSNVLGKVIGDCSVAAFIYGQSGFPLGVVDSG